MLDRAFDPEATFTADEIALIEPITHAVALPRPADERTIRRSIGALAAALPAQATDEVSGALKLKTYITMLAGCDERALAYACRRCLDELDWMPTIHRIKERMAGWVGKDAAAIVRARAIVRRGCAAANGAGERPIDPAQVERVNAYLARSGIRTRFAEDGSTYPAPDLAEDDGSQYVPLEEAA